jgi:hypothetical protein
MRKLSDSKLEIDRLAYFKSISKLSLAELNNKSHGWSILQHLYHCWLVESLAKQYILEVDKSITSGNKIDRITAIQAFEKIM